MNRGILSANDDNDYASDVDDDVDDDDAELYF